MNPTPELSRPSGRTTSKTGYFEWLFVTASDGILILDADTGEVLDANSWVLRLVGLPADDVIGRKFWELSPSAEEAATRRTFALMQKVDRSRYTDLQLRAHDGQILETEFTSTAYRVDERFVIQCNVRAVVAAPRPRSAIDARDTARPLAPYLGDAGNAEMVARLTAGIAHDFNNQFTVILGHTEFILSQLDQADPLHESAREIRLAAGQAASLTRQLLLFSRHDENPSCLTSINAVIRSMEKMLRRLVGAEVNVTFDFEEPLGLIRADPVHIGQVIMNLVVDAHDAVPDGGRLAIVTRNCAPAAGAEGRVLLTVRDTGGGISHDVRTTRTSEHRIGRGLAICQHVVGQLGGSIEIGNDPELGSEFRVYLPSVDPTSGEPTDIDAPFHPMP